MGIFFLRSRYVKRDLRKIIDYLGHDIDILDAGFGYGQYSYWLAKRYPSAILRSVEIEPVMIEDFRKLLDKFEFGNISLEKLDLTEMKYREAFDLAVSVDVMEHIEDDQAVFNNICSALKPGGVFLMHTPHIKEAQAQGEGSFVGEHVRDGYYSREIVEKLRDAGFYRVEYTLTYGMYGAAAWKLLQKYPISVLQKSKLLFFLLPFYMLAVWPAAEILMRYDMKCYNHEGNGILIKARKQN